MDVDLYNKMNDDEKLQYIWELENYNDNLEHCNYIKNEFIEAQERLYRISKDLAHEENMKCNSFRRMMEYKECMQKKYEMYLTPAYECTGEEKYEF